MQVWNYIVIVLSVILLVYMLWKEWNRANRKQLYVRLVVVIIAVGSFACLVLPITRIVSVADVKGQEAVLLTEGYDEDSVDRFVQEHYQIPIYADESVAKNGGRYKTQLIQGAQWEQQKDKYKNIHVF